MAISESARITSSTIASQSYANLYNLINSRTNIPLPDGLPSDHPFVHVREPRIGIGFRGFPFIVLQRSKPTKEDSTADLTKSFMDYDFFLRVVCRDSDSDSSGIPLGANQCETITNNIIKTLINKSNQLGLINNRNGIPKFNVDTDEDEFEGRTVFISEFDIRFEETLLTTS